MKEFFNFLGSIVVTFLGVFAGQNVSDVYRHREETRQYLEALTRLHTELSNNAVLIEGYKENTAAWNRVFKEVYTLAKAGEPKPYDGFSEIYSANPVELRNAEFAALDRSIFENQRLYADLLMHDSQASKVKVCSAEAVKILSDYCASYMAMYMMSQMKGADAGEHTVRFNTLFNQYNKYAGSILLPEIADYKVTNERLLLAVEGELAAHGRSIEQSRDAGDYYWMSHYALLLKRPAECLAYAEKGLARLGSSLERMSAEDKSLYGRLHKNAAAGTLGLASAKNQGAPVDDPRPLMHLKEWEKSGVYTGLCRIQMMNLYHQNNQFEPFRACMAKYLEDKSDLVPLVSALPKWVSFVSRGEIKTLLLKAGATEESIAMAVRPEAQ